MSNIIDRFFAGRGITLSWHPDDPEATVRSWAERLTPGAPVAADLFVRVDGRRPSTLVYRSGSGRTELRWECGAQHAELRTLVGGEHVSRLRAEARSLLEAAGEEPARWLLPYPYGRWGDDGLTVAHLPNREMGE